jgi:hypothetical protein
MPTLRNLLKKLQSLGAVIGEPVGTKLGSVPGVHPRKNKYGNTKVIDPVHGRFDSKREYKRWLHLLELQALNVIGDLQRQVRYPLKVDGEHCLKVTTYIADFVYRMVETGEVVVEDAKGFKTETYKLKKKLMLALHGIEISEV